MDMDPKSNIKKKQWSGKRPYETNVNWVRSEQATGFILYDVPADTFVDIADTHHDMFIPDDLLGDE